ncbi:mannosyltransferase family protein [Tengunoibacter tsumagoiensis]|uniref:Glycosyltransferase RgtA/B/C/D-like domain-containing protein n=1 Tax=Tengunoibacter tsumagoiensis TaxID=2014871 RepID=A0A402A1T3_9CHLR|nr:mannosyltransferase family protein [Tengunoibacter tsumagoiensis]GCE13015.1 hypothetical protein KTT_28740 [Tengunoibacter tsumagoiensis]
MKRAPVWDIFGLFFVTRLLLILVTYFGYIILTQDKYGTTMVPIQTLFGAWNHWDALIYLRIAHSGYQPPYDFAFFPLFPTLISPFAHLLGDNSYLIIGMLISNLALLGALFLLYQLAIEMGGSVVARRTLLYLCIFPTAFFFFAAYTESLFLLLTTGTFLALRRERWWIAGLLGFLAALTRNIGVLLILPFLYEVWVTRPREHFSRQTVLLHLLPIVFIPLGTLLYCLFCWQMTGNILEFATVQSHWSREMAWPWEAIWQSLFEMFWNQPFGSFNQVHTLLDFSATIGFLILAVLGWKKVRRSYTIWLAVQLLTILLSPSLNQHDPMISNQRFVLVMFPAFITMALLGIQHPRFHQALVWIFPGLLATLSLIFVMNLWMV